MGCTATCPLTTPAIKPRIMIDYLMMNQKAHEVFKIIDYYMIKDNYPSDHFPIVMKVEFTK